MSQQDLFGDALKEEGCQRVLRNAASWADSVRGVIRHLAHANRSEGFTADDVRALAAQWGIPDPHHPNAWGAALRAASQAQLIRRTDAFRKSERDSNHGREQRVWVLVVENAWSAK